MKKIILASLLSLSAFGYADDAVNLDSLDQRLKIAERKLELAAEATTASKSGDATVSAGPGGFIINSADKTWNLKLGGLIQTDARAYFEEVQRGPYVPTQNLNNVILPRRVRLQLDANLGPNAKLRIQNDFVGGLVDAYGELKLLPWATVRTGLFKTPLSLERWRSDPARDFVELGYTAALVTDRDTGAWLELADADQIVSLGAGVFNGSVDSGSVVTTDADDEKEAVAKFFTHPFRFFDIVPLRDLGIGIAASSGDRNTSVAAPGYKTLGLAPVNAFSYKAGVIANGPSQRIVPQGYWFWENFSLLGEYVRSSQSYQNPTNNPATEDVREASLGNEAYQVQAAWNITGEDTAFSGFKLNKDSSSAWGALQVAGRYQGVKFDEESFDRIAENSTVVVPGKGRRFADRRSSVSAIQSWGVALSYLPVNNVKLLLDWEESAFTDGSWSGATASSSPNAQTANRETEKVLFARAQFTY